MEAALITQILDQLRYFSTQINAMRMEINNLNKENTALKKALDIQTTRIDGLRKEINNLRTELGKQYDEIAVEVSSLQHTMG